MEEVLELYQMPYDPEVPLICMDEQPRQLIKETRLPVPMQPGSPRRYDYEYERNGTANVFLFTEPLGCKRSVHVREQKTKRDWAEEVKRLLDHDYPGVKRVRLICDNLNTHTIGALYEAFAPEEARRLAKRLELHHTPKHGSWLNIAEIELSVMTRQCLQRRIPEKEKLQREVTAWATQRNAQQRGVDWQFTTEDARVKLKRLYPQFQMS